MTPVPTAQIVQQYLVNAGVGVLSIGTTEDLRDWQISTEYLPDNVTDNVNNRVMVHEAAAEVRGRFHDGQRLHVLVPRVQLLIRSRPESAGRLKALDIYNAMVLVNRTAVVVDSVSYIVAACHLVVPYAKIKTEEKNFRVLSSMNYKITFDNQG